jgi:flagellar assembly protein FliH
MSAEAVNTYTFRQLESTDCSGRTPADVISRALAEAQEIRERAQAEGHAAGYAAGVEQARAEAAPLLTAIGNAADAVAGTRDELAESLATQAGQLAVLTAEQIIAGTIAVQPQRIIDVVRGTLRRLADRHRVTVLVNPDDLELLAQSVNALQAELGGIEHVDAQADRRVARGGAIVQTVHGEIDASIATQLQTARELVAAALAGDASIAQEAGGDAGELVIADGI